MELFLEFVFTVSLSFILSFILAKLLSFSSIIDQHLDAVSRSCMDASGKSEKYVLECEEGFGFDSEVVKFGAFGESCEERNTLEESLNGSNGESPKIAEETVEEISCCEENFVNGTTEIEVAKEGEEDIEILECEKENSGEDGLMVGLSAKDEDNDDDDDWEGIERTELEKDFGEAVCFLECKTKADQNMKLGNDLKMKFYGLHKIATEGPCLEPQPIALKMSARAKWNAWKRLGNMSPEAAMEQYINLLSRNIPSWIREDFCGDGKYNSANDKGSIRMPLDAKTMSANQPIALDYRTRMGQSFGATCSQPQEISEIQTSK